MSAVSVVFSLIGLMMIFLGIGLFFVEGSLIWSIGFFICGLIIGLLQLMWKIACWADNSTRSFFYNDGEGKRT